MKKNCPCLATCVLLVSILLLTLPLPALGGVRWAADGVGIRIAPNDATAPQLVSDGSGGAIITWDDQRAAVGQAAIYAQRVDSSGNPLWTADGVGVCTMPSSNSAVYPTITSDGSGGAIITWQDYRDGHNDIYAQKVNASGSVAWTAGGVGIRTSAPGNASRPQACSDGSGGAFITWDDDRAGAPYVDVYAQRVNSSGAVAWGVDGVAIRNLSTNEGRDPRIAADSSHGAIITWADNRDGAWDIYAQRVNASGAVQWTADGVGIRTASAGNAASAQIVCDPLGVAVIAWQDNRNGKTDIYAQQIASTGVIGWAADGVGVRTAAANSVMSMRTTLDEAAGTVITWADNRSGSKWDIYAQRLDTGGSRLWAADGVGIRTASASDANSPCIISDGSGGTMIAWEDHRSDSKWDIYAQWLDTGGSPSWPAEGMGIRTSPPGDAASSQMAPDGSGGAIAAWQDKRSGHYDIYAQRISSDTAWYLAEGSTDWGFDCYISIVNPNAEAVNARLTYMTVTGPVDGGLVALPAMSQATVFPFATVGAADFSTRVECLEGKTLGVDRTMFWRGAAAANPEAHCATAVTAPATTWYLPEGSSDWGFECYLLIQNPNSHDASCHITWMIEGESPRTSDFTVAANSRATFNMGEIIGAVDSSIMVTSDVPVIPERAMYRNERREGHDSTGTTTAAADYFLAEGCTGFGFTTYVLVQNPQAAPTDVAVTYQSASGPVAGPAFTMPANSRKTICVNDTTVIPGDDPSFSTQVHGSAPIIAERAMYWYGGDDWAEVCHDSIGLDQPHATWYMADGQTSDNKETWTLVQNPNGSAVTVEVTYMTPDGTGNVVKTETIPASSRRTFNMLEHSGINGRAAIMVKCTTAGMKIICERAMYWNNRGTGTDTIGGYSD